jgi:hypothetical protein
MRGFDEKCLYLAEAFAMDWKLRYSDDKGMQSKVALCDELAQRIQDIIEEFENEKGLNR